MIVEINSEIKTITIEEATGKELKGLIKLYPDYNYVSKIEYQSIPNWYFNGSGLSTTNPQITEN